MRGDITFEDGCFSCYDPLVRTCVFTEMQADRRVTECARVMRAFENLSSCIGFNSALLTVWSFKKGLVRAANLTELLCTQSFGTGGQFHVGRDVQQFWFFFIQIF